MNHPSITFDAGLHEYLVSGRRVASVTQVLTASGISDWSGVPDDILWDAQQRGTMVHRAAHYINQHNLDPDTVDERIAGYVEAWRAFRRDHEFQCELSEHMVYRRVALLTGADVILPDETDLEIIGTLDATGMIKTQGHVLIDLKTGEETDAWAVQTAAYLRALGRAYQYTHKRLVVQLNRTGAYRLHWYKRANFERDWDIFKAALVAQLRERLYAERTTSS